MSEGAAARRRLAALVGACLLGGSGLASGPAMAATKTPTSHLVLSSTGPASGVISLKQTIKVGQPFDNFAASFSGDFGGYLVSSLAGQPLFGKVLVRKVGFDHGAVVPLWIAHEDLPPGRYRITMLGAGPLRMSLPLSGQHDDHVTVSGKSNAFARLIRPASTAGAPGMPASDFGVPVPAGHYSLGAVTRFVHSRYSQADVGDECFTTTESCASEGDVADDGFFVFGNAGDGSFAMGSSTYPLYLGPGVNAEFDDVNAGLVEDEAGLVVLVKSPYNG